MKLIILALTFLLMSGCLNKTPVTDRNQVVFMSPQEEMQLGENSYKEILAKSKISHDAIQTQRIRRIGQRIAKAANKPEYKWEFNLVENEQINAFCLPDGKVVVYTGILGVAKNDDQLATVMSHEVAHALARHGAERMSHQQISGAVKSIGSILLQGYAPQYTSAFNMAYSTGVNVGVMLPFSRSHENEADEIGIYLMHDAGYDIKEAIKFWQNMKKLKGAGSSNSFFSTHPSDDERIKHITKIVAKINRS
jgi:predicted Zn-dependent protease